MRNEIHCVHFPEVIYSPSDEALTVDLQKTCDHMNKFFEAEKMPYHMELGYAGRMTLFNAIRNVETDLKVEF